MESTKRKLLPNPAENANWISKVFFIWTHKLFRCGLQKDLDIDDLYETLQKDKSAKLGDRLERQIFDKNTEFTVEYYTVELFFSAEIGQLNANLAKRHVSSKQFYGHFGKTLYGCRY